MRRFATAGSAVQRAYICAPCLSRLIQADLPSPSRLPVSTFHQYRSYSAETSSKESDASPREGLPPLALEGSGNAESQSNEVKDSPHESSLSSKLGRSNAGPKSAKLSTSKGAAIILDSEKQNKLDEQAFMRKQEKQEETKGPTWRRKMAKSRAKKAHEHSKKDTEEPRASGLELAVTTVAEVESETLVGNAADKKAAGAAKTGAESDILGLRERYNIVSRKYKTIVKAHRAWSAQLSRLEGKAMDQKSFKQATTARRWIISEIYRTDELGRTLIEQYQRQGGNVYVNRLNQYSSVTQKMLDGLIASEHLYVGKSATRNDSSHAQPVGGGNQPEAVIGPALYEFQRYQAFRKLVAEIDNVMVGLPKTRAGKATSWPDGRLSQVAKLVEVLKDMKPVEDLSEKPDKVPKAKTAAELISKGPDDATRELLYDLMPMVDKADQRELLGQLLVQMQTGMAQNSIEENEAEEVRIEKSQKKAKQKEATQKQAAQKKASPKKPGQEKGSQEDASKSQGVDIADLPGSQTIYQAFKAKTPSAVSQIQPVTEEDAADKLTPVKSEALASIQTGTIGSAELSLEPIHVEQPPVRGLAYGLDRVLFNPGVYMLKEPRSKVYNFDPYLEKIMPLEDFNFDLIPGFITSSKDKTLQRIAHESAKKYTGSSSSMTGMLSQFHFLLSKYRPINNSMLSRTFSILDHHSEFSSITKGPSAIYLRWKEEQGLYAIDSDKSFDEMNGLSLMGNSLEKLLTMPTDKYERYRQGSLDKPSQEEVNAPETYHYTGIGDILMRSQLDAYDPRLPGTGMFDLKTRAVLPVRMDVSEFRENSAYEIRLPQGNFESFEREYIDMLRATMIKYMLQVRIGRMDGIFVAYHNTRRIFGFQYIPLEEIDLALHGQSDRSVGDGEFKLSVKLMNEVFNKATERFPNTTLRMHFATSGGSAKTKMLIFAEPLSEKEANKLQSKNEERNKMIVKEILSGASPSYDEARKRIFPEQKSNMEASLKDTEAESVSEDVLSSTTDTDVGTSEEAVSGELDAGSGHKRPLLAMQLLVTNMVNGRPVVRPGFLSESDKSKSLEEVSEAFSEANGDQWTVQYDLREFTDANRARSLYQQCLKKREKLVGIERDRTDLEFIRGTLRQYIENGRKYRKRKDLEEGPNPTKVVLRDT